MRSPHTTFLIGAVLSIVGVLVGSIGLAAPARALTITFPEKGFPKVEAGTVLGETSSGRPESESRNTTNLPSKQREESMKTVQKENSEKEQGQKFQKLLQTTKPVELELKKNTDDQDVTVSLREPEKRKESSEQPKAGILNKGDERVNSVEVKLRKDLKVKSTQEGFDISNSERKASTTLPVHINTSTKELSVVTPNGTKVVKTLPDEAVAAIQNSGFNGQVVGEVKLETHGEDLVYKVRKEQSKKMFGMLPVTIRQDVQVSATTGEVTATQQSITDRIFNFFSF